MIDNSLWTLFLGIGGIFGFLAALIAYLILYGEYIHHFQGDTKRPRKMALEGALFTFVFFFLLSLLGEYFLANFIINK